MILIYEKEKQARVITTGHGMHTYLFTAWMTLDMVVVMAHNST